MSSSSYLIRGKIVEDGSPQSGATVTVRNHTKSEETNVSTASDGSFVQDLDATEHFASGYANGDEIRVTWSSLTRTHTVSGKGTSIGANMSITLTTKINTETLTLGDGKVKQVKRVLAQTLTLADGRVKLVRKAKSETLSLADSKKIRVQRAIAETLTLTDSTANRVFKTKILTETLGLGDVYSRVAAFKRSRAEGLELADSRRVAFHRALQEGLDLSDSRVGKAAKKLSALLELADVERLVSGKKLTETLSLADSHSHVWDAFRKLAETLELAAAIRRASTLHLAASLVLDDLPPTLVHHIGSVTFSRVFAEDLLLADAPGRVVSKRKALFETLELQDSFTHTGWAAHLTLTASMLLSEGSSKFAKHLTFAVPAEILYVDDLVPGRVKTTGGYRRTLAEVLYLNDFKQSLDVKKTLAEWLGLGDSFKHGGWLAHKRLSEKLLLGDVFGTSLYGPFFGVLALRTLASSLALRSLVSDLTLAQLRALLNLREEQ